MLSNKPGFTPATHGPLANNNGSRNTGILSSPRRATPIPQINRGAVANNNSSTNSHTIRSNSVAPSQPRATPILQTDRGARTIRSNSVAHSLPRATPIPVGPSQLANRNTIAIRVPGLAWPPKPDNPGATPNGQPATSPPNPDDQGGGKAQIEQTLLDLLQKALEGAGQTDQGQSGQGNGQGQTVQAQGAQPNGQGQAVQAKGGSQGNAQGRINQSQGGQGGKAWSKVPDKAYALVRVPSSDAAPTRSRSVVTEETPSCLTKEYLESAVVLFKDVCTKEWAINSTGVTGKVASLAGRSCLTKQYLQSDIVPFRDTCTNEWAMNPPEQQARAWQLLQAH
jgi:hypothetical protein